MPSRVKGDTSGSNLFHKTTVNDEWVNEVRSAKQKREEQFQKSNEDIKAKIRVKLEILLFPGKEFFTLVYRTLEQEWLFLLPLVL